MLADFTGKQESIGQPREIALIGEEIELNPRFPRGEGRIDAYAAVRIRLVNAYDQRREGRAERMPGSLVRDRYIHVVRRATCDLRIVAQCQVGGGPQRLRLARLTLEVTCDRNA